MFELLPYERFRDTPSVRFFDVTVETSNARDLVIHTGPAVSPPNDPNTGAWQFYLHPHQEDNLLAASGGRTFFLVNLVWDQPFHIVRLESGGDILRIPPGTFHRSISDDDGSVVLNQAVREPGVSLLNEFRVYNSDRIPALMRATLASAPTSAPWRGARASGGLNQIRAFTHRGCRQLLDLDAPTQITRRSGRTTEAATHRCCQFGFR